MKKMINLKNMTADYMKAETAEEASKIYCAFMALRDMDYIPDVTWVHFNENCVNIDRKKGWI